MKQKKNRSREKNSSGNTALQQTVHWQHYIAMMQ